jgi:hypothetical protein
MVRFLYVCLLIVTFSLHTFNASAADAVLLRNHTVVSLKGRTLTTEVSNVMQINNRKGEKFATIAVPYSKMIKVSELKAHITDLDGNIIGKLKPSAIRKKSLLTNEAFFQDAMELEFTLTSHRYPYLIHYSYVNQQTDFMYLARWIPVLDTDIETRSAQLILHVPVGCELRYFMNKMELPDVKIQDGVRSYTWRTSYNGELKSELYSPPLISFVPELRVVPLSFNYSTTGSFQSWKSYGSWQFNVNNKLQKLPDTEIQTIQSMIKGVTDSMEMVRVLYHYLQDRTRYVNISIENGGLIPVEAQLVALNKYGDCKGLTNYMMALLRTVGIRSHYTDVYAGSPINYIVDTLPAQQFNHVILAVPLRGDTLWLDCTSKGPFNYAGTFIQNRTALLIDKEESKLVTIPPLALSDVQSSRTISIRCDSNTINRLELRCIFRGDDFESVNSIDRRLSVTEKNQVLHHYFGVKNSVSENFQIGFIHRDSMHATLNFSATSNHYSKKFAGEWHISPVPFSIPQFRNPGFRQLPVQIDYPICVTDTQTFEVPGVHDFNSAHTDVELVSKVGRYFRKSVLQSPGKLVIYKHFELYSGRYSLQQYPEFYDFIRRATEADTILLVLKVNG